MQLSLKPTFSRRWLAAFLLAGMLPLALFGLWGTRRINVLVDEGLKRTLASETGLMQSLVEQKQDSQRQLARQTLRFLDGIPDSPGKSALVKHLSSEGGVFSLLPKGNAAPERCYFERHGIGNADLQSVCAVWGDSGLLVSRRAFPLAELQASAGRSIRLRFEVSPPQSGAFKEQLDGRPYLSRPVPLNGVDGRPVAYLIVSESQALMSDIRHRRQSMLWVILLGTLSVFLVMARRFRVEVLDPVQAISDVAQQVSEGNLERRVPETIRYEPMLRTARQFNQMLGQLAEKQQLQDNFIATLTHDFRTPLVAQERAFELFGEEFRQAGLPHLEQLSEGLIKNNRHLLSMVNQLLEAYQFDAGKLALHFQPVVIKDVLEDCIQQLGPLADEKSIAVRMSSDGEPPVFEGDIRALQRVFLNILGNAVENIPKRSEIGIGVSHDAKRLLVTIRDNGPGLREEEMAHLFDRFYSPLSKNRKLGSGLGLYICRVLVEAHSGSITVDSRPGQFTAFTVCLPLERNG